MSEDRTQEPSKRRRIEARERGQVARSPELTGAAGLLAASALLGIWGDGLIEAMVGLVREPWLGDLGLTLDPAGVVDRARHAAWGVAGPLLGILGGSVAAMIAAHQAQVGGLIAAGLIAPDPTRLWNLRWGEESQESGWGARAGRGVWSVVKAAVVVAVAGWVIRAGLGDLFRQAGLEPRALARAASGLIQSTCLKLAGATLILGLIDFASQRRRFEAMMRLTPDEHREDLRAADGDPALRSRRQRMARALRGDAPELLRGAALAVVGPAGLVVILVGGPPPRRVTVRSSANGANGQRLRRSIAAAKLLTLESPALSRSLALLRGPTVPPELAADLGAAWPVPGDEAHSA